MPDVLIATSLSFAIALPHEPIALPYRLGIQLGASLALILLVRLAVFAAGWMVRRWQLQRTARIAQTAGLVLAGAGIATITVLGFIRPLLAGDERSLTTQDVGWIMAAGLVTLLSAPLAWRRIVRWRQGARGALTVAVRVPVARMAALCLLSLAVLVLLLWQGQYDPGLPAVFILLYFASALSFLLTLPAALRWLLARARPSLPSA